jgi:hypothetical protein
MKKYTLKLTIIVLLAVSNLLNAQENLKYTIVKDNPELHDIANLYISPQLIIDGTMLSTKFDFPFDGVGGLTIGYGGNIHAIILDKYSVDANLMLPAFPKYLGSSSRFDFGGGWVFSTRNVSKEMNVVLESQELSSERRGDKVYTTTRVKSINMPGTIHKYKGFRGGMYIAKHAFEGEIDKQKMEGYTNHYGVYGGLSFASITNLQAKVGNYKHLKGIQDYRRWYVDMIIAPGFEPSDGFVRGSKDIARPSPLGFRFGFDYYKPTTGIMSKSIKWEIGHQPGYNGFYALVGIGFSIRAKITAFMPKEKSSEDTQTKQETPKSE